MADEKGRDDAEIRSDASKPKTLYEFIHEARIKEVIEELKAAIEALDRDQETVKELLEVWKMELGIVPEKETGGSEREEGRDANERMNLSEAWREWISSGDPDKFDLEAEMQELKSAIQVFNRDSRVATKLLRDFLIAFEMVPPKEMQGLGGLEECDASEGSKLNEMLSESDPSGSLTKLDISEPEQEEFPLRISDTGDYVIELKDAKEHDRSGDGHGTGDESYADTVKRLAKDMCDLLSGYGSTSKLLVANIKKSDRSDTATEHEVDVTAGELKHESCDLTIHDVVSGLNQEFKRTQILLSSSACGAESVAHATLGLAHKLCDLMNSLINILKLKLNRTQKKHDTSESHPESKACSSDEGSGKDVKGQTLNVAPAEPGSSFSSEIYTNIPGLEQEMRQLLQAFGKNKEKSKEEQEEYDLKQVNKKLHKLLKGVAESEAEYDVLKKLLDSADDPDALVFGLTDFGISAPDKERALEKFLQLKSKLKELNENNCDDEIASLLKTKVNALLQAMDRIIP